MSSILMNIEQWIWSKMKNILKNSWIWNITYLRIWSKMNGENALDPVLVNLVHNVLTSQLGRHANQKSHLRLLFRTPNCCFRYFKPTWDVTSQSGDDDVGLEFVKCFTPAWCPLFVQFIWKSASFVKLGGPDKISVVWVDQGITLIKLFTSDGSKLKEVYNGDLKEGVGVGCYGRLPKKVCNVIFRKWGGGAGGSKAIWTFSENKSDLVAPLFPKFLFIPVYCQMPCMSCQQQIGEGYKDQENINSQFGNINGLSFYPSFDNRRLDLGKSFCKKNHFLLHNAFKLPLRSISTTRNCTTLHYNNLEKRDVQKNAFLFYDSFALISGQAF